MSNLADQNSYLQRQNVQRDADIRSSISDRPFSMQKYGPLALDTAATETNPYKIGIPFDGVFVRDATDSLTTVKLSFHSSDSLQLQNAVDLKINDSFELPKPVGSGYLQWAAQAGKTLTLFVFLGGKFKSGSQLSLTAGGVSITEGSAFVTAQFSLTAATASVIFAVDTARKMGTWRNETSATVWVGTSVVSNTGSNKGIPVLNNEIVVWRNSAALYGYSVAGATDQSKMTES